MSCWIKGELVAVSITPLELGRRSNKRKFLELCQDVNGEEIVDVSHWIFLCETGDYKVLVDSGPYNAKLLQANGRGEYAFYNDPITMLGEYSDPASIDFIVLTHLHWDHCANSNSFPKSRILVQADEVKYASNPIPLHRRFYDDDSLSFMKTHMDISIIEGNIKIGDSIEVFKTPGHTPGSQTVLVNSGRKRIAFQGDNNTLVTGRPPGISSSIMDWWHSKEKLNQLIDLTIPAHDPSAGNILKEAME